MQYILDVANTSSNRIRLIENILENLPFVQKVTPLQSDRKVATLADLAGLFKWNVDGLDYQNQQRGN